MAEQYTNLMAQIFNQIGRSIAWPNTPSIELVKKGSPGYATLITVSTNWFAYRTEALEGGSPVIAVLIIDGTDGITQLNLDKMIGVSINSVIYRKQKVYPPFGEPAFWRIEVQPTGEVV